MAHTTSPIPSPYPRPPPLTRLGYMFNPSLSPFALSPTLSATSFSAVEDSSSGDLDSILGTSTSQSAFSPTPDYDAPHTPDASIGSTDRKLSDLQTTFDFDMVEIGRSGVQMQAQQQQQQQQAGFGMDQVDFDQFLTFADGDGDADSGNESHSPVTASPTRTPPSYNRSLDNVNIATTNDLDMDMGFGGFDVSLFNNDFDYLNEKPNAEAGPSTYNQAMPLNVFEQVAAPAQDVVVKQEPVEFGWNAFDSSAPQHQAQVQQNMAPISPNAVMGVSPNQMRATPALPMPSTFLPTTDSFTNGQDHAATRPSIHQQQHQQQPPTQIHNASTPPSAQIAGDLSNFSSLPLEQQLALHQLLLNMMSFQANMGGFDMMKQPAPAHGTIDPSQIFAPGPAAAAPAPSMPASLIQPNVSAPAVPQMQPAPQSSTPMNAVAGPSRSPTASRSDEHAVDDDDELVSVADADMSASMGKRGRSMSTFSNASGWDEKLDRLAPLNSIFSAGRGKGGKKGGGMSSVVRGEDEDLDDDDSWRPSAEEYKKLSSKEKRQLRNKLSARAFRNRRKDYIGTLEGHIKERDDVIDEMRSELQSSKSENQDLRRELEALKKSTMSIIHPATAVPAHPSQVPSVISALTMPLPGRPAPAQSGSTTPLSPAPRKLNTAPTPQFNPRKDFPANGRGRGAGGEGIFGGPPTICHTILTPEVAFGTGAGAPAAQRQNMNPRLAASTPTVRRSAASSPISASTSTGSSPHSTVSVSTFSSASSVSSGSVYSHASSSAHSAHAALNLQQPTPGDNIAGNTFEQWMDANPFSLRSMDSYRMQMWSRLAREAQADKVGLVGDLRPKFYTERADKDAATVAHVTSKIAQSFIGAFSNPTSEAGVRGAGKESDKLTSVVTGRAHLKSVSSNVKNGHSIKPAMATGDVCEKQGIKASEERDRETDLVAALGGLKLQSGPGMGSYGQATSVGGGLGARSDPLGFIGGFLGRAAHPTRA